MWVCFVTQSCNLNANLKYIFNCILNLFGNDFKSNFTYILSFLDSVKPVIIELLDSKEFMLVEIIPYFENPLFYKFNNSEIFEKDLDNEFNKSFFKLSKKNFEDYRNRIIKKKV